METLIYTYSITPTISFRYELDFAKGFNANTGEVAAGLKVYLISTGSHRFWFGTPLSFVPNIFATLPHPYLTDSTSNTTVFKNIDDFNNATYVNDLFFDTSKSYYPSLTINISSGEYLVAEFATTESYATLKNSGFYDNRVPNQLMLDTSIYVDGTHYETNSTWEYFNSPDKHYNMAATISCTSTYLGEYANINIKKWDNDFTVRITYDFYSASGVVVSSTNQTSYQWLVPGALVNYFPASSTQGTCLLTAYTYDKNGNAIGNSTFEFKVMMDANGAGPLFNPEVVDINNTTIALTGDNTRLIKYFSTAKATGNPIGQGGASIKSQSISNGDYIYTAASAEFPNIESPIFEFSATDSRGYVTRAKHTAGMINYSKLSCNIFNTVPTVQGDVTLTITGNFFNGSFGAVNNTLKIAYRKRTSNGSYGEWISVTPTISGTNYSIEIDLTGLDYRTQYLFQAKAQDALMVIETAETLAVGKPVYDWNRDSFHITPRLELDSELMFDPDKGIGGTNIYGDEIINFTPVDSTGNTVVGYGNYTKESGDTLIYGNNVDIIANNNITFNGRKLAVNTVLWSGASLMDEFDTVTLSENISDQATGVVLVFSLFRNNVVEDVSINTAFVSKEQIALLEGAPHFFFMAINAGFSVLGGKYLYISNNQITGHSGNNTLGEASHGLTFDSTKFVLRYVIGV